MPEVNKPYSLETIFKTLLKESSSNVKKRLIFDQKPLGGIPSKWLIAFMISLPFFLFIGLFNPTMFAMLGIVQSIIFFIVFLSMIMILVTALAFINNNKVLRQITPSWEEHFPEVDLRLCLKTSGTPYKDFLKHYKEGRTKNLTPEAFKEHLVKSFKLMESENQELSDAIKRNQGKR
ncbi:MAG TPA: hypothetical protein ENK82_03330 [Campylobacterales bacterium]|nr:hypothetical protein [Campylobacterales bacterium]HHS92353.1 hypothetical protein [Campylobacterales bacterium]